MYSTIREEIPRVVEYHMARWKDREGTNERQVLYLV